MDRYGLEFFLPTEQRQATVVALLEKGHADRCSCRRTTAPRSDWFPREVIEELKPQVLPDWSMTRFCSRRSSRREGARDDDEQLDQMMVEKPKLWLA